MPTAGDYRLAAVRYRTIAENLLREAAAIDAWRRAAIVGGGPILDLIAASVDETRRHLAAAGREVGELAAVCDRRASICDEYAARWRRFLGLDPLRRLASGPPPRPAPWADP